MNYFDINIQKLIIEILISDSGIKIFLSENNNIYKSVDSLIIHFKEKLSNKFSKIILENSTPEAPQNDNPKSNGIIKKDENKITDHEESVININLRDFLQEKKINENDYETLLKALLKYVKQGVFPCINEKIVIKTSMKKFGWAVNSILKECDLKINSGVLKFAQNNISLFENNKEVFDETNFRNTYIYKLFTENPYKKKNN